MKRGRPASLAVLLSGTGTTLQNLIDKIAAGELPVKIAVVVSSRPDAYGVVRAHKAGIPVEVINRKDFEDPMEHAEAVKARLAKHDIDLIVLAGYNHIVALEKSRQVPAINIHPALIPAFSGKGFYGDRVHKAVLEYGVRFTGVTVHFVDDEYDHGPVILQETVEVRDDDTVETLRSRVQQVEHRLYPTAIKLFAEGRLKVEGRRVKIMPRRRKQQS
ncbi:MAG: phosphoribosylglycinamide formyltransferase [Candidatus Coatesbacteria bacterium]|nr:phosphoribosylglycinamide formyltransferase [Candidatus Coatesbacteria bacterium]